MSLTSLLAVKWLKSMFSGEFLILNIFLLHAPQHRYTRKLIFWKSLTPLSRNPNFSLYRSIGIAEIFFSSPHFCSPAKYSELFPILLSCFQNTKYFIHCLLSLPTTKPIKPKQFLCFLFSTQMKPSPLSPTEKLLDKVGQALNRKLWNMDAATSPGCKWVISNMFTVQAPLCFPDKQVSRHLKTLLKIKWKCCISFLFTCSHRRLSQEMKVQVACAAHPSLESPDGADIK